MFRKSRLSHWLLIGIGSFLIAFCATLPAAASGPSLKVKTHSGKVMGKQDGDVRAFLGIPYAAPPVGPLRWKPPMPLMPWSGVRQTTAFGSHCMQPTIYKDMIFRDPGISEDCLTLNIWTPAKDKHAKLPVMVWIYGGGFLAGGSSEPRQDGANLAGKNGVIVVSMNYRLGIFGFFAYADLAAESPVHAAGNYGLMDQLAAIRWVHDNIKNFGGDPKNVTIFGESAGSFSVSSQMASPLAKGLFQHAIGESGAAFFSAGLAYKPLADVEKQDQQFAERLFSAPSLEQLRAFPAQRLLEESMKPVAEGRPLRFAPDIDGYFLPQSVPDIFAAGKQNDVPLLAGWNRDEGGIDLKMTLDTWKAQVAKVFADHAAEALALYPASTDAEAVRAAANYAGDRFIAFSTWKWLEAQTQTGKQPVYRYRFDLPAPLDPNHPQGDVAYHSSEIPYVFGTLDLLQGFAWRPEDRKLSEQMQKYWTDFARSGNPNAGDLPQWPAYAASSGWEVMHLDSEPHADKDDSRERYLFLDRVWGK